MNTEEIEIPFGARDSELKGWEYTIPKGMEAIIKDGKIIVREQKSEDERIRKNLIELLLDTPAQDIINHHLELSKVLAYLERRKEQIPYIDFVIKPHKGDDNNPYDMRESEAQDYAINRGFGIPFNDGKVFVDERYITQTIGNILRWADEHPKEQKPVEYIEFDDEFKNQVSHLLASVLNKEHDYTEGFVKYVSQSLLEYAKIELKPAEWSEEDEIALGDLMWCIEQARKSAKNENDMGNIWFAENWVKKRIKSLCHPKHHWKPSKEQMNALNSLNTCGDFTYIGQQNELIALYNDLKKL